MALSAVAVITGAAILTPRPSHLLEPCGFRNIIQVVGPDGKQAGNLEDMVVNSDGSVASYKLSIDLWVFGLKTADVSVPPARAKIFRTPPRGAGCTLQIPFTAAQLELIAR